MKINEIFNIPKECEVGSKIPKKQFYENANLKTRDKSIFTDNIHKILWCYSLKEENIRITEYKDSIRDYKEVEIFHVSLKKADKINRIADVILRTITYPTLIIFQFNNKIQLFVAHKKEHLSDSSKVTLEEIISTEWIDLENLDNIDKKLFESLQLENLSFSNFYKFYSDIVDNINVYNASKAVGRDLALGVKLSPDEIKEIKDEIDRINDEISLKRNQSKKETQFNKQMEFNIEIHNLQEEIKKLEGRLV
ncbi:DUF4391 domain-containing protein [Methanobrevibacter curvatus]|uniref:DUF4391 domain-containing protein n=1 Tax=Methanobrevibacter curvatus TaxID=49547 RepID=A0A166E9G0_9EURY|nr:DUF4391 domain-containing protein [Methanobrevibacter curvatus]KZX16418.1 hypothetical protein MBCUR_00820 [Methanobrevibacter curvatus]